MQSRKTFLAIVLGLMCTHCAKCAPGLVGPGVARLTIRNVGAVADLINKDSVCGFESPEVKKTFSQDGAVGQTGSVTWYVDNCDIDLMTSVQSTADCTGNETSLTGRVMVSAERTVVGTLTGDPNQPVVPLSADAVTLELTRAQFDRFKVRDGGNENVLTNHSGELSATVRPLLAAAQSTGICSVPTRNVRVENVRYASGVVRVVTPGHDFFADVPDSNIQAVNGVAGDRENFLGGDITVWDSKVDLSEEEDGLNPDYDRAQFQTGFACTDDLKLPVSHECGDLGGVLAQGGARLTVRNLGTIAKLIEEDTRCGFSSPAVLDAAQLSAPVGAQGTATFRVEACTITMPAGTQSGADCSGNRTAIEGSVTVSATKTLRGRLTGDRAQPVVPVDDHPALVEIREARFDNFKVSQDGTALRQINGALRGTIEPRTAMDTALTACGFKTPIARMSNVEYLQPADVEIFATQGRFLARLDGSNLTAVNGSWGADTNVLRGTIQVNGQSHTLPDDGLVPNYDQAAFDRAWMCGTVERQAPFECDFVKPLAQGASQLSVLLMGTLAKRMEADTTCGFASDAVLDAVMTTGNVGDPGGSVTFNVSQPCTLTFAPGTEVDSDCNGGKVLLEGTVQVTGTKVINGYVSGDRLQPAVPTTRDPAVVSLAADFQGLKVTKLPQNNALLARSGRLTGSVRPRLGIDTTNGACSLPTPVASMEDLTWASASLQVTSQGKTFDIEVASSSLDAVNGVKDGRANVLEGNIRIDGKDVAIPIAPGAGLDPDFDPARFEQSFACTANLRIPASDAECDMQEVIAKGTARLLVSALGTVTSVSNKDKDCGYSAGLTDPSAVIGQPGQQGALEWEIQSCALRMAADRAEREAQEDCLGRRALWSGEMVVSGRRRVEGLREEIVIPLIFFELTFQSIVPNSHEAVEVEQRAITFNELRSWDMDPGATQPARGILIHSGSMSAMVNPIVGESRKTRGRYDVPTRVARMTNVRVQNASVQITYQGKRFNAVVDSAELNAFNGSYAATGEKNLIDGTIVVSGRTYHLAAEGLDPEFDQQDFDNRYRCTDDLRATIPPAP